MTDLPKPHQGIELDTVDLSELTGLQDISNSRDAVNKASGTDRFLDSIRKEVHNNDAFLSFSSQIHNINSILNMKYSSANDIAGAIVKDMALTTKLLKLVNSAFYGHLKGKGVSNIAEAMIILGTEEIKMAAASLKLFELMENIGTVPVLKKKTLQSLQRSIIANQIVLDENIDEPEAVQVATMLYDFGQYLVALYYPGLFIDIEIKADEKAISMEEASKSVIGLSYSELGINIASQWNLPPSVINAMIPIKDFDTPRTQLSEDDIKSYICSFIYDLCNIEFDTHGTIDESDTTHVCSKYQACLGIQDSRATELLNMSREKLKKHKKLLSSDNTTDK